MIHRCEGCCKHNVISSRTVLYFCRHCGNPNTLRRTLTRGAWKALRHQRMLTGGTATFATNIRPKPRPWIGVPWGGG